MNARELNETIENEDLSFSESDFSDQDSESGLSENTAAKDFIEEANELFDDDLILNPGYSILQWFLLCVPEGEHKNYFILHTIDLIDFDENYIRTNNTMKFALDDGCYVGEILAADKRPINLFQMLATYPKREIFRCKNVLWNRLNQSVNLMIHKNLPLLNVLKVSEDLENRKSMLKHLYDVTFDIQNMIDIMDLFQAMDGLCQHCVDYIRSLSSEEKYDFFFNEWHNYYDKLEKNIKLVQMFHGPFCYCVALERFNKEMADEKAAETAQTEENVC